ncbi:OmpA family protein [Changchengzhania lutea]|uniref:OmpA family protein n=1 Tax=Changchengzhania lutea TaxID=2049305 RepID=UPI00115CEBD9|nr:OmpA family protein [Changchengzhania lutea]
MKFRTIIIVVFLIGLNTVVFSQSGLQKKADKLFNKFAFVEAAKTYHELIEKGDNITHATRQLADSYAYMRNPDSAAVYYKLAVQQENLPKEYYYKYAQALRGTKDYEASRLWMKRFKDAGGTIEEAKILNDDNFLSSIFNAKPQYTLSPVNFNSKFSDFGAYEQDGKIYYASAIHESAAIKHVYGWNEEPFLDIYAKEKSSTDSLVPHKLRLKGAINSIYHEGPLTISQDGKTMYFSRNNFTEKTLGKDDNGTTHLKIYKAALVEDEWTNIEELPFNSDTYSNGHPALNHNGSRLYFTSDMPGGFGGSDIYYVDISDDDTFGEPQNLGDRVNTDKNEMFPFLNDEDALFFSSHGHLGLGLLDIFGTAADSGGIITNAINLGIPINSSKDDFSFFMNNDGVTGYIASNRGGGLGSDDIYEFKKTPLLNVEGIVSDSQTNTPIENAEIKLFSIDNRIITTLKTDENGFYNIQIDRDTNYKIIASKDNYKENGETFTSSNIENTITAITINLKLNPLSNIVESPVKLNQIYFDFNKSNIRADAAQQLDNLIYKLQNTYPNMTIRIESHTDVRGSNDFNDELSKDRAKATYIYLISNGIEPSRIKAYEGFGKRLLSNNCDGTVRCTEEQHQLNRRTQFIVVKTE